MRKTGSVRMTVGDVAIPISRGVMRRQEIGLSIVDVGQKVIAVMLLKVAGVDVVTRQEPRKYS